MRYVREEMRRRNWILVLAVVLASAVLAAGCGDDDDSEGDTTDVSVTTTATETTPATVTDDSEGGSLIEQCVETSVAGQGLSEETRGKIREACEKSASGADPAETLEAAAEACRAVAEETLAGQARAQAIAACGATGSP
jgi:hypothetical protein